MCGECRSQELKASRALGTADVTWSGHSRLSGRAGTVSAIVAEIRSLLLDMDWLALWAIIAPLIDFDVPPRRVAFRFLPTDILDGPYR
jgi:hypothetical protein